MENAVCRVPACSSGVHVEGVNGPSYTALFCLSHLAALPTRIRMPLTAFWTLRTKLEDPCTPTPSETRLVERALQEIRGMEAAGVRFLLVPA
ncbi:MULTISPECIES: hypothetical protein [Frankia]|uniref:hypothetical protein n=1 Tax=Frankia TaxID=1854 RepID=UPI0005A4F09A|nr:MULTISPECIES: hypothetical protein [Frankia]